MKEFLAEKKRILSLYDEAFLATIGDTWKEKLVKEEMTMQELKDKYAEGKI